MPKRSHPAWIISSIVSSVRTPPAALIFAASPMVLLIRRMVSTVVGLPAQPVPVLT